MARQAHHSKNWGGARAGAGGKVGSAHRMTKKAIEMAESAKVHPFQFLLSVVSDESATVKDRLFASSAALPYCLSKKATELIVHNDMEGKSNQELRDRLETIHVELLELNPVIEGELAQ